jgi:hypothetical protein
MSRNSVAVKPAEPIPTAYLDFKSETVDHLGRKRNVAEVLDLTKKQELENHYHLDHELPDSFSKSQSKVTKILSSENNLYEETLPSSGFYDLTTSGGFNEEVGNAIAASNIITNPLAAIMLNNNMKPQAAPTTYSIVLSKWSGYIESIKGSEFTAVLTDVFGKRPDIRATFSINEVSESDRRLVVENALFDWVINRERKTHGQITNYDVLIFKRLPMWKKSDLNKKSKIVEGINAWLKPSNPDPAGE